MKIAISISKGGDNNSQGTLITVGVSQRGRFLSGNWKTNSNSAVWRDKGRAFQIPEPAKENERQSNHYTPIHGTVRKQVWAESTDLPGW